MQEFDPVEYINTPRWQASRLGLERIVDLLERMGRPQDRLKFVHVAGTNGKGSTCAFLDSVLRCAGYKVGLFTSPYIEVFEERIRVNGENISREDLSEVTLFVREFAQAIEDERGDHPTEFELMTAVALEHFARSACDIVVLEVGLGGRLDSTNAIDAPEVCVLARIGLDHTALLGSTVAEVAAEKAGIVKSGATVVSWPQEPEAMAVVERVVAEAGCALTVPDFDCLSIGALGMRFFEVADTVREAYVVNAHERKDVSREAFVRDFSYKGVGYATKLLARYQPMNAALALEAVEVLRAKGWVIGQEAVGRGIAEAVWPGRFEVVALDPLTIIDGGHNPQGAQVLAESVAELLAVDQPSVTGDTSRGRLAAAGELGRESCPLSRKATFVMGVLADKDYEPMIREVLPLASAFYVYTPSNPRALSATDLASSIVRQARADGVASAADLKVVAAESPAEAMRAAREAAGGLPGEVAGGLPGGLPGEAAGGLPGRLPGGSAGEGGIVVAFGSLYSIAELKAAVRA